MTPIPRRDPRTGLVHYGRVPRGGNTWIPVCDSSRVFPIDCVLWDQLIGAHATCLWCAASRFTC